MNNSIVINLNFTSNEECKKTLNSIRNNIDYSKSYYEHFPGVTFSTLDGGEGLFFDSEYLRKIGTSIRMEFNGLEDHFTGTFDSCHESFSKLATQSFSIIECFDSDNSNSVFYIGSNKCSGLDYCVDLYSIGNRASISHLFLPEQRVRVQAIRQSYKWEETQTGNCNIKFKTQEGQEFMYRGTAGLAKTASDTFESKISFNSNFELAKYKGKLVSSSLNPSCISLEVVQTNAIPVLSGANLAFYKQCIGFFIDSYIKNYNSDISKLLMSINRRSICGVAFKEFAKLSNCSNERDRFSCLGLDIYIQPESAKSILITGGLEWINTEYYVSDIEKSFIDNSIDIKTYKKNKYIVAEWLTDDAKVHIEVWRNRFEATIFPY